MDHSVFMFLLLDILVDSVLAIVNSASLKTGVHVSFQIVMFSRSEPRSGVAGSHGSSVCTFFRNLHAVFQCGCTLVHPQSVGRIPFSLRLLQHFFFGDLSDDGHSDPCVCVGG